MSMGNYKKRMPPMSIDQSALYSGTTVKISSDLVGKCKFILGLKVGFQ
jgi:hypothetical protein